MRQRTQFDTLAKARTAIAALEARRQKIFDLFGNGKLSEDVYRDQTEKVGTRIKTAQRVEGEAVDEMAEIEFLVDFAVWLPTNAPGVWMAALPENKRRLQQAVFPNGLEVTPEEFGTLPTDTLIKLFSYRESGFEDLASPAGFEPALPP
jgi:hypothetical protein